MPSLTIPVARLLANRFPSPSPERCLLERGRRHGRNDELKEAFGVPLPLPLTSSHRPRPKPLVSAVFVTEGQDVAREPDAESKDRNGAALQVDAPLGTAEGNGAVRQKTAPRYQLRKLSGEARGVQDYMARAPEYIKPDGGPPRWFCPVECGRPPEDAPLLFFLPGMDGTGLGLIRHYESLRQ